MNILEQLEMLILKYNDAFFTILYVFLIMLIMWLTKKLGAY